MDQIIATAIIVMAAALSLGFVLLYRSIQNLAKTNLTPQKASSGIDSMRDSLLERERGLAQREERITKHEDSLKSSASELHQREKDLRARESSLNDRQRQLEFAEEKLKLQLAQVANLSQDEAKTQLQTQVQRIVDEELSRTVQLAEHAAEQSAEERAKNMILNVVERSGVRYVAEATTDLVPLESDDLKGKIVGREGRNIRAFEQITGVDLLIDEAPGAVVISSFDPVRREVARQTLQNLIADGRIQPARIEELYEKAKVDVDESMSAAAIQAVADAGVEPLNSAILHALGQLKFRSSYSQNVLSHSVEVARIAGTMAEELGFDAVACRRAGLLHDIGKGFGTEYEGPHALAGMSFLKEHGEKEPILNAVGAHHYDIAPLFPESKLVIVADGLSAARPGARRESLENHTKRLSELEALAGSFPSVERSYAVQSGREIRLIVKPESIDDLGALRLASEVARKIESELNFPGQIKVTVIRETRATDIAK